MDVNENLLAEFEDLLNPAFPEKSGIIPEILGYGEISTTFSIPAMPDVALKRMPPFENADQIVAYKKAVCDYTSQLEKVCGIRVAEYAVYDFFTRQNEHIVYVAQPRLETATIGNHILAAGNRKDLEKMIPAIMEYLGRLYQFNHKNSHHASIGLDGQLSNWSFPLSGTANRTPVYFDITTPLLRVNDIEQLDTEIFLKSCPLFLVWLVRWQFLDEVLNRYHDVRMILIDLVANFYKEGRQDLIDGALIIINDFIENKKHAMGFAPLNRAEIDGYYKNDAFLWSLFLMLRQFDRFVKTRIFMQRYNFILPGAINR